MIRTLLKKYWKSILMTLLILVLSFAKLPTSNTLPKEIPWDKIAHFLMYLSLTSILMYDSYKDNKLTRKRSYLICIAYPLILGVVTEFCQSLFFFPRVAEWYDWLSNVAGFFAGWGIFMIFKRKSQT